MKNVYFFGIFLLILLKAGSTVGQSYYPLLNDSMTWDAWSHDYSLPFCSETDITRSFVNGDTVINTFTYKRISGYHAVNITPMPCPVWAFDNTVLDHFALLREDTAAKQVWRYDESTGLECLLFDFSLSQGDTFVTSFGQNPTFPDTMLVDSVNVIQLLDGTTRNRIFMHPKEYPFANEFMIEGIGGSAGLFLAPMNIGIGFATLIGCVLFNNNQLFNPWFPMSTTCPGVTGNLNQITGNAFVDLNSNNIFDAGDSPMDYIRVTENSTGNFDFTDMAGNYQVAVTDSGNFEVEGVSINNFNAVPASHSVYFNSFGQVDSLNDFAYQPLSVFDDLEIFMAPTSLIRSGLPVTYRMRIKNTGTTNQFPVVVFHQDTVLDYVSSTVMPFSITSDSITWNLPVLAPFQQVNVYLVFNVDTGLLIGTPVTTTATVMPVTNDVSPANNTLIHNGQISGSFDPNDISVDRDTIFTNETANPPFLTYLIRFQNTGNDTAFSVTIENKLHLYHDVSTLEFVSTSHPMQMNWNNLLNQVEFVFDGINLPDSTTNEPASHGHVAYRVKPIAGLAENTYILIRADIYFDLNPPVTTNWAQTVVAEPSSLSEWEMSSGISMYPNPVGDRLFIKINSKMHGNSVVRIYDTFGRLQLEENFANESSGSELNTANLPRGIYLVKISNGTAAGIGKIVKQ